MQINTDMSTAPHDRRILVKTVVKHYMNGDWVPDGDQWVEAIWREAEGGSPAQFCEWCGNERTRSTGTLYPIAWTETPDHDERPAVSGPRPFTPNQQALWHTLAVGMFYRDQESKQPAELQRWDQQTLGTKLEYQARAKKALAEAIAESSHETV